MVRYNSQLNLEVIQNNEPLSELWGVDSSSGQQGTEYFCDVPKQFFLRRYPQYDAAWNKNQQEKQRTDISEIGEY